MPLSMAKTGETFTIKRITGRDELRQHLSEMGFVEGEQVSIVSEVSGNLIIQIKDGRVALDKKVAERILV